MKLGFAWIFIIAATVAVLPINEARHRRDVSEIVKEYLPPSERLVTESPVAEYVATEASGEEPADVKQDTAVLGNEGYEYKTVRRLKLRHRRDVSEITPEYLPPSEEAVTDIPIEKSAELVQDSAILGDNGYQYKTVRRLKLRHRRDVSEITPEYLPPTEDAVTDIPIDKSADLVEDSAVLGDDGYQYKTIRRLKLRHRRDVSEITPEYLPPTEEVVTDIPIEKSAELKQDSAVLGDDGYQYKTIRRLKLRHRRDVSEITPEYLPPTENVVTDIPIEKTAEITQDSAVLANDGYQYKTVRRLKLRHRRAL